MTASMDDLPVGWERVALGELADLALGKMLDRAKRTAGTPLPYLRNLNVRWGKFDLSDLSEMPFENHELERYGLRPGDVLVCEGGEPGRAAVWPGATHAIMFQKAIHRVRCHEALDPFWLVQQLRYDALAGRLSQYFTGTTIKHFTGTALSRYEVVVPPIAEQRRIVANLESALSRSQRAREALDTAYAKLRAFDEAVMGKAFRGELAAQEPGDEPASAVLDRIRTNQGDSTSSSGPASKARTRRPPRVA